MPKVKTLKSAKKRFRITASGKFKRKKSNLRHILTKKSTHKKRHLRSKVILSHVERKTVRLFFPYM
ncbi:50S ribosomal protein L35 [Buchnera aphidicola]|uniref:50S ribosomal protein L35 n=1 Tax=Buchnera aphidicola TaxID=9 RepID=UPI0031B7F967